MRSAPRNSFFGSSVRRANMRKRCCWLGMAPLALLVVLVLAPPARSQSRPAEPLTQPNPARAARPDTAIKPGSCVTAECHASIKRFAVVHAPIAANACESCHELKDARKHTFAVMREKADLCTYCHEFSVKGMPAIHKPVIQGQCLGCHDPHGGATRALTLEKSVPQLCNRCHESVTKGKTHLHGPVAEGACDSCHPPHAAKFPKLLDAVGTDLCLACHKEMEPSLARSRMRHKALEKGCEKCHDSHGSQAAKNLVAPAPALCWTCHEKLQTKVAAATVKHSALSTDRTCMNCHVPHTSNRPRLLAESLADACLKCHSKDVKASGDRIVAAVPDTVDPKLVKHGEIKDGQCAGCHEVHGSTNNSLLVRPYSTTFYKRFSLDDYALCFGCHDRQLAEAGETAKATNFRNGSKNLHFVHANIGNHDRNCRACHLTHAGREARIVRPTFKYGKWEVPISFAKTDTGGSCAAGCHVALAYDRQRPVVTTAPASRPAPATARAEKEDARIIAWTTRTAGGGEFKVPAARPTLLLVLSTNDVGTIDAVRNALGNRDSQVAVILVGDKSDTAANTLAAAEKAARRGWSFVADISKDAAGALEVRGWPTALVLKADGAELTRLSGNAAILALKLPLYVDLAGGRLDANAAATQLAPSRVSEEGPDSRAARNLRDTQAATLTRCEALIASGKYEEAKSILEKLLSERLAPVHAARVHLLLGRIYEHKQDFRRAAEHYRVGIE